MEKFQSEQTFDLIRLAQSGESSAKSRLLEENMGLVLSIAKRFYNRGYDKDEINQLGSIGLLRAIENFNLSLDVRFSTYAVPVILGEIKRFLRDDGPIKVSRSIKQTASKIAHFTENYQKTYGKNPGICDIAQHLGIEVEEVITAQDATRFPESISKEFDSGNSKLENFLKAESPDSDILTKIDIKAALSTLPDREKTIISMRYFLDKTQTEVAKKLGISQVQVSRLEKKILEKLRTYLECES